MSENIFPFIYSKYEKEKFEQLNNLFLNKSEMNENIMGGLKVTFESERVIVFEHFKFAGIFSKKLYEKIPHISVTVFVDIDFSRPYIEDRLREMALEEIKEEENDRLEKDIANRIKKIKKQYKKDELFTQL